MKKLLFSVLAAFAIITASAQFKVEQKQSFPEAIWREAFGWVSLYKQDMGNGEYYYLIGCRSSNQFDDMMLINLGRKAKAKATLLQFHDLYVKGEIYELEDDKGEKFTAQCIAMNNFRLFKRGYAGYGTIQLKHIRTMLSVLEE